MKKYVCKQLIIHVVYPLEVCYKNTSNFKYWLFRFTQIVIHLGFGKQKGGDGGKVKFSFEILSGARGRCDKLMEWDVGKSPEETKLQAQAHRTCWVSARWGCSSQLRAASGIRRTHCSCNPPTPSTQWPRGPRCTALSSSCRTRVPIQQKRCCFLNKEHSIIMFQ